MALPQMDADPTAFARRPEAEPVTTATCVHEALAGLRASRAAAAVVYESGRPVGVVSAGALTRALGSGRADATVASAMDYVAVHVDRSSDAHATVRAFADAAWDWLRRRRT